MSRPTDLATECEGVRKAARNLGDDLRQLAAYVYERASAYMGADHEAWTVALILAALEETSRRGGHEGE